MSWHHRAFEGAFILCSPAHFPENAFLSLLSSCFEGEIVGLLDAENFRFFFFYVARF